jgi:hypothetical protein
VRSIDWEQPVASDFRCGLYESGEARILAGALDAEIAALAADATNEELLPLFLAELMQVNPEGPGEAISLQPEGDFVYSIPNAGAFSEAALDSLRKSPAELAAELQTAIESATRVELDLRRRARACAAAATYPTAPIFPDIGCP